MSALQWHCECGNSPCNGLDCGVYLPGRAPRKRATPKAARELSEIRMRAWETRRQIYGQRGHS
jgi:hypothetical protein